MANRRDIIVVGGGIIGASIAWHLVSAGARVRLVTERTGGVATQASFAWINASWGNPEPYFRLRTRSMAEWRRLAVEVPNLQLARVGGLCWDLPQEELLAYAREHRKWGYGIREVSADEVALIEPNVTERPAVALHVVEEGAAEPVAATLALIENAKARGLAVLDGMAVTSLEAKSGRLAGVRTPAGLIEADTVVLASGVTVPDLAATLGIDVPITAPPGLIVHAKPVPKLVNGLVLATELHVRQTHAGRIIAGSDFGGTDPGMDPGRAARALFDKLRFFLSGGESLEMDFYTVGYRPTPKDGFPILGQADGIQGLYLAVTHSGITLAPAVGRFAAEEILHCKEEPLLAPYRLSRFA